MDKLHHFIHELTETNVAYAAVGFGVLWPYEDYLNKRKLGLYLFKPKNRIFSRSWAVLNDEVTHYVDTIRHLFLVMNRAESTSYRISSARS